MKKLFQNILWTTDFSREGQEALLYADLFAKTFGAQITALHVMPDFSPALYSDYPIVEQELARRMITMKKRAQAKLQSIGQKKGIAFKKALVAEGSASKRIIETAEKEKVDLIVMGKRGQSVVEKILIGSVANHVLRHSPVPVLVTRKKKQALRVKKILVPTDFAKEEDVERDYAWKLAEKFGASMTFLYVLELYGHEFRMVDQMFQSVLEKFQKKSAREGKGTAVSKEIIKATHAAAGIEEYTRRLRFDLIVMVTCAHRLSRFLLGSTTEKVISHSDLPVLALPPKFCE
jgi:nucleotide-binding universal stress UspA family protein